MAKPIETRSCEHCNKPVKRDLTHCESCGKRLTSNASRTRWIVVAVVVIIAVFGIISVGKYMSGERFEGAPQSSLTTPTHQDLV